MIAITRIAIIAATINFNCRKREMGMCECADTICMKLFHCKIAFYRGLLARGEEPGNNGEFKPFTLVPEIWQVHTDCRTESLPPH